MFVALLIALSESQNEQRKETSLTSVLRVKKQQRETARLEVPSEGSGESSLDYPNNNLENVDWEGFIAIPADDFNDGYITTETQWEECDRKFQIENAVKRREKIVVEESIEPPEKLTFWDKATVTATLISYYWNKIGSGVAVVLVIIHCTNLILFKRYLKRLENRRDKKIQNRGGG